MKNTNSKEFKSALKAFLLPMIEEKAEDYNQPAPEKPFTWLVGIARNEVPHEFAKGDWSGMAYWLSGMGLNALPVYYSDIIEAAEMLHGCKLTDDQAERVCDKWFTFIAAKILQFASNKA